MPDKIQILGLQNDEISLDRLNIPELTAPQNAIANLRDKESIVLGANDFPDHEGIEEKHITITYYHDPKGNESGYAIRDGWEGKKSQNGIYYLDNLNNQHVIDSGMFAYAGTWIGFGEVSLELPVNYLDYSPEVLALGDNVLPNIPNSILLNENNTIYAITPYGEYIAHSDRGLGNRKENQDGLLTFLSPKGVLMLNVFDGMALHKGSEEATAIISNQFGRAFSEGEDIHRAINRAGLAMQEWARQGNGGYNMGACMISAKIENNNCTFYHLGDCKGVVFNLTDDNPKKKHETIDHSVIAKIGEKERDYITKCLVLDEGEYNLTIAEESKQVQLSKDSWVILGSDGLWKVMDKHQIEQCIRDFTDKKEDLKKTAAEKGEEFNELLELLKIINHQSKLAAFQTGKDDNFTIILYKHNV